MLIIDSNDPVTMAFLLVFFRGNKVSVQIFYFYLRRLYHRCLKNSFHGDAGH